MVRIEQAIGDPKYGDQNTDGSKSIRDFYLTLRQAGATARLMLERAAAATWGVAPSRSAGREITGSCTASGRTLGFGELATLAAKQPLPAKEELRFKSPDRVPLHRQGGADRRPGRHLHRQGGLRHRRPHAGDGVRLDRALAGARRQAEILRRQGNAQGQGGAADGGDRSGRKPPYGFQALGGVAVIADSTWAAMQGRQKLKVDWEPGCERRLRIGGVQGVLAGDRAPDRRRWCATSATWTPRSPRGGKIHEAEYYVPHLAHAPMEPPAAVAEYRDGKVTIWAATQNPQAVQETVAKALCGIAKQDVICHVTSSAAASGGNRNRITSAEAAILSKTVGKPVKVTWSREDDIRFDYYHTVAAMYLKAATDAQGRPTAWLQRASSRRSVDLRRRGSLRQGRRDGPGLGGRALRHPEPARRERAGPEPCAHRLAPFGGQHLPRLRGPVVRRRAGRRRGRATGSSISSTCWASRACIDFDRPREPTTQTTETARPVPLGHGTPAAGWSNWWRSKSGWANRKPEKGRALRFCGAPQFSQLHSGGRGCPSRRTGPDHIPRVDVAVDAGRVIHPERVRAQFEGAAVVWREPGPDGRDHGGPGPDPAVQLPRLPGGADQRGAA